MSKLKSLLKSKDFFSGIIRHAILSWLIAATVEYFLLPEEARDLSGLACMAQMSLVRAAVITCCLTGILFVVSLYFSIARIERWCMAAVFGLLATATIAFSITRVYLSACVVILIVLGVFAYYGRRKTDEIQGIRSGYFWITVSLTAAFFLFVSAWTVGRVYSFSTPTYDFGLFSQMFYHMKETGLPMTTLERDGLLSHFAVHVSPIYYLMLPFYCLIPTPATLQVLQAAVLASAVIPLWKIGKHHGMSELQRMFLCALLLLYPAYAGGTSYDLHENCFLTPLILWTFYGVDKKNIAITVIASVLTLTVKEDAAVYVAVIALWLILKALLGKTEARRKSFFTGVGMLAVSVAWFLLVTAYLSKSGDGVMSYRYDNFMYDGGSSLLTVIKSAFLNPMKILYECADAEKLTFILLTLLPLAALPLLTRKYERYVLLIPYILVNLMPDYQQQHDIFFQYTFGSFAFLIYLTAVNLSDLKADRKRLIALGSAVTISAVCFCTVVLPKGIEYPIRAIRYSGYYQSIRDTLDTIPDGASVASTTGYTTYLSEREILYYIRYCSEEHLLASEYVVLNFSSDIEYKKYASGGRNNGFENLVSLLEENGYTKFESLENVLVIYKKDL